MRRRVYRDSVGRPTATFSIDFTCSWDVTGSVYWTSYLLRTVGKGYLIRFPRIRFVAAHANDVGLTWEGGYRAAGRFGATVRRREEYLGCPCGHVNPHFRSHEPGLQYFSPAACIYKSFVVQNSIWNGRVLNKPLRARGLEGPGGRASQSLAPGRCGRY